MSPLKFGPPPPLSPPKYPLPLPRRKALVYGARESGGGCTTTRFIIEPRGGADDRLMIGIDAHNGEEATRLLIRGAAEAGDMPAHLRWIADQIEKHAGKRNARSIYEYVTVQGGGR